MFVPLPRSWTWGWCQYNCHPTFQELVESAEAMDEEIISSSIGSAFFAVTDEDLLNNWLALNTQGQRNEEEPDGEER